MDFMLKSRSVSIYERLWKDAVHTTSGCWEFQGTRNPKGYGRIRLWGHKELAHRAAWIVACGEIPRGLHVLHRCDNPPCVNPDHLWVGSNKDNSDDKMRKHRQRGKYTPGERHPLHKLTDQCAYEIRERYLEGYAPSRLAELFAVSRSTISGIIHSRTWTHLGPFGSRARVSVAIHREGDLP